MSGIADGSAGSVGASAVNGSAVVGSGVGGRGLEARRTLVRSARVVDAGGSTADGWVLLDGDVIRAVGSGPEAPTADEVVDLGDAVLVPGFVDLHGHGGGGAAYEDDSFAAALAVHRRHGTTRSVLSLVANPLPSLVGSLAQVRSVMATDPLVLGVHLEGPFLSPQNKGAHNPDFLVDPSPDAVDALLEAGSGVIRQVTIAPELPGATRAIERFVAAGVVVAVGHTVCSYDQARRVRRRRDPAHARVQRHAGDPPPRAGPDPRRGGRRPGHARTHPRRRARAPVGGEDAAGRSAGPRRARHRRDGGRRSRGRFVHARVARVTVSDGVALVAGTDTIAGSTLTQDQALRNAVGARGPDPADAVAALTTVPARALGSGTTSAGSRPGTPPISSR